MNSSVERFLYVVLLLIFLALGVGGFFLDKLLHDNQRIAKQNRAYTRCVATVFAHYTHDFVPVTIINLDKCTVDSQTKATNDTPNGGTIPVVPTTPGSVSVSVPQPQSKVLVSPTQSAPKQNNPQVSKPDNDGVILDLPLLPKIHIPSPL